MVGIRFSCPLKRYEKFGLSAHHVRCLSPPLRCPAAVGGVRPTDNQSLEITKLTDDIRQAEARLAALFEPGRPMPRAGMVAAMRQEVSELKANLAAIMSGSSSEVMVDAQPESDDELAERARQAFLEIERLVGPKSGGLYAQDDAAGIAVLEAENERLRLEATALLLRQQQLEELVERHNLGRQ
ncbi:hypothetical protein Vretimale_508 [Volvox reticuliferus]|uniref:Uncharacterized protein n=1 Tax=Volvox reticuliferus TaxID=1737510 RepID=A0A8J4C033_9CHLO|nr:hypothetical protein Vretifemale_2526 [Volvox reticuliferus]GIL94259.1 hypothetical protein Vretimale_508 [Volvox reticuliferus]